MGTPGPRAAVLHVAFTKPARPGQGLPPWRGARLRIGSSAALHAPKTSRRVNRAVYLPPYREPPPFFPAWRPRLAPLGSRLQAGAQTVQAFTWAQLEKRFASVLPPGLFPKAARKANSRHRLYPRERTFYHFLWPGRHPLASCRKAVQQIQARFKLRDGPPVSGDDGASGRARRRLPRQRLQEAGAATARKTERRAPRPEFRQGRPGKVTAGAWVTLADTPAKADPKAKGQNLDNGFPILRLGGSSRWPAGRFYRGSRATGTRRNGAGSAGGSTPWSGGTS